MAAVTGGFAFKPILASSKATSAAAAAAAVSPPFSLSSLESSKLFGVRLSEAGSLTTRCSLVLAPCGRSVACRYGGGGGGGGGSRYSGSGDWRRSRQSDSDDDQALDVSTIRSATVRLIDQQQNMVGVVSKSEAIRMAEDAELDLVILSPDADPPVVRIMDYRKFKYEQQKKKREQQKKSAASRMDMKELKMGLQPRRARTLERGTCPLFWSQIKLFCRKFKTHQRNKINHPPMKSQPASRSQALR
ncbi:translation initiation factor IF3-4, chloroplastic-like isoform X2 [Syzygium oleosum]|uniref:translation initiation factor IF3-4, chloroplastic-like isoform X2 n=1 Tax=Syzygium oleosum TaxID=219896 RepID=UPI0024B88B2B|nr:translation initiation factor IF3-4, chloroplastic-like isoform X2 [Syzygium oleosum]